VIIDWTHDEAVEARRHEVEHMVHDVLDAAEHITIREALDSINDDIMKYHAGLIAVPSRLLGLLLFAESKKIITHDQMQELYDYVETVSGEYVEKRSAY
jgi:hypothetical protein